MQLRDFEIDDDRLLATLNEQQGVRDFIGRITRPVDPPGDIRVIEIDGVGVGVVGVVKSGHTGPAVELICALLECAEGKKLGSAACLLFLKEFRIQEDFRLIACVSPNNPAGSLLASKLGFVATPERRRDEVVYVHISA